MSYFDSIISPMPFKKEKLSNENNARLETISILFLIAFALISYIFTNYMQKKPDREISIYLNGIKITEIDGKKVDALNTGTYTLDCGDGDFNTIEIKGGKVRCIDANCPDKICVSHGYLNPDIDNDMIVCAPHKLIIQYR